ncbi:MAG: hypothetical protein KGZ79_04870, partial [Dethiobacter sp.]|nr:hypothetical protein [Dethiobacter sp.]
MKRKQNKKHQIPTDHLSPGGSTSATSSRHRLKARPSINFWYAPISRMTSASFRISPLDSPTRFRLYPCIRTAFLTYVVLHFTLSSG